MNTKTSEDKIAGAEEIKNPSRYMTLTYVISLSIIAALSLVVHFMLDSVIAQQAKSGEYINISGQQRMLSQRSSLFALEYLETGNPQAKEIAEDALTRMQQNHQLLLSTHQQSLAENIPSPLSPELAALYFDEPNNVQTKLKSYVELIGQALAKTAEEGTVERDNLAFLQLSRKPLLEAFDNVVKQYERESRDKVSELRSVQEIVLGIIILTILIEALFIFRPMVRKVSEYASRLQFEANHDVLSGLLNRRAFNAIGASFFENSRRYENPVSTIILDIDHFKLHGLPRLSKQ
ncbi:type IV pili methyl-accepting chemotaxis transducer N-terminal domain-containing protein [Aliiglaciecola sp. CAU 1673]|uniref:sensor domain-containing diguanylate cyclase n=1 Tax=Aliiglaciecola sp. CAU 1673 TaxID=3032595 RepID=UPI0023DB1536|nr:type IV pili methyl-accepting chemotaxis transducer N-terminal domain-containing protein [Aliiglaciecola sp. CAU 1673]MDF2178895.1 type IV pili methyl-accepting chemotaxis transducer N-terminal domain-containing protein [Aliiglaciecola sp. CAU 1673]